MKRSVKKTRWNLIIILVLAVALTYGGFKYLYPTHKADIFLVNQTPELSTGGITITGMLQKNTTSTKSGDYLILLDDLRVIYLNVTGLDRLIGQKVTAQGLLVAPEAGIPGFMTVNSITVEDSI